jgi:uncharacterized protein YbjT (DUF2867 family)/uncharacterized membrane protein YphA (DoxX/SURF4 family)
MRILVTGGNGFIGGHVTAALEAAGHSVVRGIRRGGSDRRASGETVICDFARDHDPAVWERRLQGMDAVVNCAGILRETRRQSFDDVHVRATAALYEACVRAGVKKVVQVSALGDPRDSRFISSKYEGDKVLMSQEIDWVILRPSVVYSTADSYGGTSLIRALAALPFVLKVPGSGKQLLQPVSAEDLGRVVVAVLEHSRCNRRVLEVVGPRAISFREFLLAWRAWLGIAAPRSVLRIPLFLVKPVALLGEWLGRGPLGMTMYRMLQRGNVGSNGAYGTLHGCTGVEIRSVSETLAARPAQVQDRWHARLYLLRPVLRGCLALVWIASGVVGFVTPLAESHDIVLTLGIEPRFAAPLVYGASAIDLALGLLLVLGRCVTLAGVLMIVSVLVYSITIGIALPQAWLEPFGGLLKNIALIPAIFIMLVLEGRK